ncbi:hypothetical protein [Thalassovita aquimarina]|uniref:Secreted protein n=1 Tax=Thalassovita aquimarina TaxID=2785917 RepID=A0ABS5HST0_9RHOB|nr:hypothetical protein [Thalassovita aquimarina]MBR9651926.1 hypothetical protein [Thalassovita aquimarina]
MERPTVLPLLLLQPVRRFARPVEFATHLRGGIAGSLDFRQQAALLFPRGLHRLAGLAHDVLLLAEILDQLQRPAHLLQAAHFRAHAIGETPGDGPHVLQHAGILVDRPDRQLRFDALGRHGPLSLKFRVEMPMLEAWKSSR